MIYAFQDTNNLYLVSEFMPGGDLRYYMNKQKGSLNEEELSKGEYKDRIYNIMCCFRFRVFT